MPDERIAKPVANPSELAMTVDKEKYLRPQQQPLLDLKGTKSIASF